MASGHPILTALHSPWVCGMAFFAFSLERNSEDARCLYRVDRSFGGRVCRHFHPKSEEFDAELTSGAKFE